MFETIVIFIAFICYSNSLPQNIAKNEINYNLINDISSIAGGDYATPHEAPWQVNFVGESEWGEDSSGGVLIHKKAVLTAAHCCQPYNATNIRIKYGGIDRTKLAFVTNVTHMIIHPKRDANKHNHDICVLILANEVKESDNVKIIEMADTRPVPGTVSDVTGWGLNSTFQLPHRLRHGRSEIISNKDCQKSYKGLPITEDMLCTHSNTSGTLVGDSGGPLVANNKLVGVVSFGNSPAKEPDFTSPDVFANVALFKKWIQEQIKKYT